MASDPDLQELAEEEIKELEKTKAEMEKQLLVLLLPKDPDRDRSVVMEIRAGTGGDEAALFAAKGLDCPKEVKEHILNIFTSLPDNCWD